MEIEVFDVNTDLFENFEIFEKLFNNYLKVKDTREKTDYGFMCNGYSCERTCPMSRARFDNKKLNRQGYHVCRGDEPHWSEYKRYEEYLKSQSSNISSDRIQYASGS